MELDGECWTEQAKPRGMPPPAQGCLVCAVQMLSRRAFFFTSWSRNAFSSLIDTRTSWSGKRSIIQQPRDSTWRRTKSVRAVDATKLAIWPFSRVSLSLSSTRTCTVYCVGNRRFLGQIVFCIAHSVEVSACSSYFEVREKYCNLGPKCRIHPLNQHELSIYGDCLTGPTHSQRGK